MQGHGQEGKTHMATQHGKKYVDAAKLLEPGKLYQPGEALELLRKMNYVKFDPTVEIHMKLGVDPRARAVAMAAREGILDGIAR